MALDQIASFLGFQLLHSLNLLISTVDDDLFGHAKHFLWRAPNHEAGMLPYESFFSVDMVSIVINSLIDYYLSHVVSIMLILESERIHAANQSTADFNDNIRNTPTTRSLTRTTSFLYQTGGLRMFLNGLQAGIVYRIAHFLTKSLLQMVIFRHYLLKPIANVISTVLLAELHMAWTHATISATPSTGSLMKLRLRHKTWKSLAIPSLIYAAAQGILIYLPEAADSSWNLLFRRTGTEDVPVNYIAYFEVSTMLPTLIMRMTVILPVSIALVLIEASFLSQTETTIVPSTKGRRSRMATLVWGKLHRIQSGFSGVYGLVRGSTYFWLWELHVKRCLLQAAVDLVVMFVGRAFGG